MDVIVSEWMGYALFFEAMLDSVLHARDRRGPQERPGRPLIFRHITEDAGGVAALRLGRRLGYTGILAVSAVQSPPMQAVPTLPTCTTVILSCCTGERPPASYYVPTSDMQGRDCMALY